MNTLRRYRLFAAPSFFSGLARIWDWSGAINTYNRDATPVEADYAAIRSDWEAVGDDMRGALSRYERIAHH
ncbi:MAG: hypothetical protein ACM3S1_08620 [Hyphomicrobiales bacterium]